MSGNASAPPKSTTVRTGSSDKDAFAQVEKWLALIREVAREQAKS